MEDVKIKFFSKNLIKVGSLVCLWYVFIFKGFSKFFIGFGLSPLDVLAEMLGAMVVPIIPTYFVARYLSINKGKDFITAWFVCVLILLFVMTIGMLNGKHHWW
jgi:hypothetical protein